MPVLGTSLLLQFFSSFTCLRFFLSPVFMRSVFSKHYSVFFFLKKWYVLFLKTYTFCFSPQVRARDALVVVPWHLFILPALRLFPVGCLDLLQVWLFLLLMLVFLFLYVCMFDIKKNCTCLFLWYSRIDM